jgi:ABC-type antimicrobial peptide transport system permease subunit
MALGASRAVIVQLMLRRIAVLLAIGLGGGLCLALALRRVVAGVVPIQLSRDGGMIAAVVALLALIGFIAALAPVRRAASIDPMQALRSE